MNNISGLTCYQRFANVYDYFMSDAPYDKWTVYIDRLLRSSFARENRQAPNRRDSRRYSRRRGDAPRTLKNNGRPIVLDLACGTGSITVALAEKGYDMIGVDQSNDMLAEARQKADAKKLSVLFLAQDMRELDLYGTVDAALCVCDGLNYILKETELTVVFEKVARFLNPGGVFIFDMNTEYKFKEVLGNKTFTQHGGNASYLWKNRYDTQTAIHEYALTVFTRSADSRDTYFNETHYQRAYPPETIAMLLENNGFQLMHINKAYTHEPLSPNCERISFVAVKSGEGAFATILP